MLKIWPFVSATICVLVLAGITGCGQKQNTVAPASQNASQPDQGNGAAPGAPHVDASKSPIADPASPLYGWEKFSSAEGKFSAIFPKRPTETDETEQGANETVQVHIYVTQTDSHDAYDAAYRDYPNMDDPKMLLARIEETMLKKHNGKIVSYKAMQVDGHPATEFEFILGDNPQDSSAVRLISVGQRVYSLLVVFSTAQPHPDEREAFFNSFSLQ